MAESLFDIAFSGQLMPGADPAQVKTNLVALFKADDARIEALLSVRTLIKKGVDESTARNYQRVLAKAGAQVEIVPTLAAASCAHPGTAATTATAKPVAPAPAPLTVAEPGVMLVEPLPVTVREFDLSGMSLAEVGVTLVEPSIPHVRQFDLSGLQLAPPGTILDEQPPPAPANIDTSELSLAKQ